MESFDAITPAGVDTIIEDEAFGWEDITIDVTAKRNTYGDEACFTVEGWNPEAHRVSVDYFAGEHQSFEVWAYYGEDLPAA